MYNNDLIGNMISFGMVCNPNASYIIIASPNLYKYDQNWNELSFIQSMNWPKFILNINYNSNKILLVSEYGRISEIKENFTIIRQTTLNVPNGGSYFNRTSCHLIVASALYSKISVLDSNLTLIYNISVPYNNNYMVEWNNLLYVSSTTKFIMILDNEVYNRSFQTLCSTIKTFAIDQNGVIAVNCYDTINYIYLYNSNGSYTGQSWLSPIPNVNSISLDNFGHLIITSEYGLYIFSTTTSIFTTKNYSTTYSCFKNSIINNFYKF